MFKKILNFLNDNHWFIIAGLIAASILFMTYSCQSTTESLMTPDKKVTRTELQTELEYYVGIAKARSEELDTQDAIKQQLIDAANIISQTGTINPSGLLNLMATIGAISFGLNRNQKVKAVKKELENNVSTTG